MGIVYLLPTLTTMLWKLDMLPIRSPGIYGSPLTMCEPQVITLKVSIKNDSQISSRMKRLVWIGYPHRSVPVLTPQFKLPRLD